VSTEAVKLTTYFGEHDRSNGRLLADELLDLYGREQLRTSVLLRGIEGFGIKHRLQTQRLLTLSEDLPLVAVAVDSRPRIEALLPRVEEMSSHGLITLERARLVTGDARAQDEQAKLTVYVGRQLRAAGSPAWLAVIELLHRRGVAGATALLGVDGTAGGVRQRARFFGANAEVPVMIIAVGDGDRIGSVLTELEALLAGPLMTLERVRVCKRDGSRLALPIHTPEPDVAGLPMWQKLMVYSSEKATHHGQPLYSALVRRLRGAGAAGATALRGFWGYHGDHAPHGDRLWHLRREVPVVTVVVDTQPNIACWFEIVDELTAATGLVTSELVPAVHAPALLRDA
jgi:PII-like signaling protein